MSRLDTTQKRKVLLGIEPRSPASETSVITTTLQNLLVHIVSIIIRPISWVSSVFHLSPLTFLSISSYDQKLISYVDYRRSTNDLSINYTRIMPSADLPTVSTEHSVVGTYNLEPDHFSSQVVPHHNPINHSRLRNRPVKTLVLSAPPWNPMYKASSLQIVHIVRPLCLLTSTSIRPLRGLMHDGSSHAALRSHFSFLMLGLHVPTHLPSYFPTSLCHSH